MPRLPQRTSLVAQTVDVLREAIAAGRWPRWLPGEIELARRLQVSRATLRAALALLEREKLIRGARGRPREIASQVSRHPSPVRSRDVALLSPAPLHRLPTSTIVWIDELRGCLAATGRQLDFCENVASYRRHPQNELEALASRVRPAAWVLYRSTPEIQRWFGEHAPHAVIAGSPHARVGLSSVDVDYAAASRHAAGRFLACGHRRLAIVRGESRLAGDFESVAAFHEACGHEAPSAIHDGSVNGICASLEALFAKAPRPTGLFVFHARPLLTVLGWLQARGLRVPRGVSVLCRDDEPFLDYALPAPARYKLSPTVYARKFCKLVIALAAHGSSQARQVRIIPEFESGATLAAVAE